MKDISQDILAKIKAGHLMPASRFRLAWKSYAFWLLMLLMLVVGALSVSLIVFNLADFDPRLVHSMQLHKFFRVFFLTAPYLWVFFLLVTLVCGVLAFRQTSRGYRQSLLFITSLGVLVVSILGVAGHLMKINKSMNTLIQRSIPAEFREISGPREGRWNRPGDGLIGGEVLSVGEQEFSLRSFRDEEDWRIVVTDKTQRNENETIIVGDRIGVIGEKTGELVMQAFSLRKFPEDWDGRPPRKMEPHANIENPIMDSQKNQE